MMRSTSSSDALVFLRVVDADRREVVGQQVAQQLGDEALLAVDDGRRARRSRRAAAPRSRSGGSTSRSPTMSSLGRPAAAVRMMTPPVKPCFSRNSRTMPRRRARSSRDSILRDTPTWSTVGMKTRNRPAIVTCDVRRAPLVPSGSLATWTRISCPSRSSSSIFGCAGASARPARRPRPRPRRLRPTRAGRTPRWCRRRRRRRGSRRARGRCRRRRTACRAAPSRRGPCRRCRRRRAGVRARRRFRRPGRPREWPPSFRGRSRR